MNCDLTAHFSVPVYPCNSNVSLLRFLNVPCDSLAKEPGQNANVYWDVAQADCKTRMHVGFASLCFARGKSIDALISTEEKEKVFF
jgi:hypothetical protein